MLLCLVALLVLYVTTPPSGCSAAEQDVDRAAASLGVQWESTPLARMNELVQAGEWDAAESCTGRQPG